MTVLAIALLFSGFIVQTVRCEMYRRRLNPPKTRRGWTLEGIPMPSPDDPRWEQGAYTGDFRFGRVLLVEKYTNEGGKWKVSVNGRRMSGGRGYAKAVVQEQARRLDREALAQADTDLLRAIEGD